MADPADPSAPPPRRPRPARAAGMAVVVIEGPIARADAARLCGTISAMVERGDAGIVICDVGAVIDPDLGTVDVLVRLALTARRLGAALRLRHACGELRELLVLVGLTDVVPVAPELPVEARGQAEQREHPLGVEEGVEPADPPV